LNDLVFTFSILEGLPEQIEA